MNGIIEILFLLFIISCVNLDHFMLNWLHEFLLISQKWVHLKHFLKCLLLVIALNFTVFVILIFLCRWSHKLSLSFIWVWSGGLSLVRILIAKHFCLESEISGTLLRLRTHNSRGRHNLIWRKRISLVKWWHLIIFFK